MCHKDCFIRLVVLILGSAVVLVFKSFHEHALEGNVRADAWLGGRGFASFDAADMGSNAGSFLGDSLSDKDSFGELFGGESD